MPISGFNIETVGKGVSLWHLDDFLWSLNFLKILYNLKIVIDINIYRPIYLSTYTLFIFLSIPYPHISV